MKKQLVLSVPKPCSEKWSSFTSASDGGFCSSCSKVVIDFTDKSQDEIADYFGHKKENTCGRFRANQLTPYVIHQPLGINPGWKLLITSLVILLVSIVGKPSFGNPFTSRAGTEIVLFQENLRDETQITKSDYIIKGIIKDEEGVALAGVNIYLKGSTIGTVSNADGQFEFPQKLNTGDILVFSFIGLETKEYVVPSVAQEKIEISMSLSGDIMMGEVVVGQVYAKQPSTISKWWGKIKGVF
jgi:hypothetical protein